LCFVRSAAATAPLSTKKLGRAPQPHELVVHSVQSRGATILPRPECPRDAPTTGFIGIKKKDFKKTVQFNPSAAPPTGILCPNSMPLVKLSLLKKT
jgi:hypothetical protein